VDGDGQSEWLVELHYPSHMCEVLPAGSQEDIWTRDADTHRQWQTLSDNQQLQHARQFGWISSVRLLKDGLLHLPSRHSQLLRYQQEWLVLSQGQMYYKHNSKSKKNRITLSILQTLTGSKDNKYQPTETCSYWYNYE
jgi:hypothetical protein